MTDPFTAPPSPEHPLVVLGRVEGKLDILLADRHRLEKVERSIWWGKGAAFGVLFVAFPKLRDFLGQFIGF